MSAGTVLVVDDSPTALRLTASRVAEAGYRVVTAIDGEEAVAVALREQPVVVVLDIILPKQNGYEVCRQLRQEPRTAKAKIVMLSSKGHSDERAWGLQQGADRYLVKPYAETELLAYLQELSAE